MSVTVSASTADPITEKLQDELNVLDHFYEYDAYYMYIKASQDFISWPDATTVKVSAADFEAALHKYFVIDDSMIENIRSYDNGCYYNKDENTYTAEWLGGFGGSLPDREYLGYVKKGGTYEVYYRNLTYGFLDDALPEGTEESDYAQALNWPEFIEYNGVKYEAGPNGYSTILSRDNFGRKYTVEINGDVVRIISCTEYKEGEQPSTFDDGKSAESTSAPETSATPETTTVPETSAAPEATTAPETSAAPETTTAPETTKTPESEAPKSSGCGSVVGNGFAVITLTCIAVTFARKREE